MRLANKGDKKKVVQILTDSFMTNPTVLFMIRNKGDVKRNVRKIAKYAFEYAYRRNGVYISDSGNGAAITYHANARPKGLMDVWLMVKLAFSGLNLFELSKIMRHTKTIRESRPEDGDYLYFWFFGVDPEEKPRRSGWELFNGMVEKADSSDLPIYAETTIDKNKRVYERYGFEVYKSWYNDENDLNVWMMRRLPHTPSKISA